MLLSICADVLEGADINETILFCRTPTPHPFFYFEKSCIYKSWSEEQIINWCQTLGKKSKGLFDQIPTNV